MKKLAQIVAWLVIGVVVALVLQWGMTYNDPTAPENHPSSSLIPAISSSATISTVNVPDGKWHEDDAAGCMMEPSDTPEGYEIIRYDHLWQDDDYEGFQVPCP